MNSFLRGKANHVIFCCGVLLAETVEDAAAARGAAPDIDDKAAIIARNKAALAKRKEAQVAAKAAEAAQELPAGWKRVESRSRPGEYVYENLNTEERQAWFPDAPAQEVSVPSIDPESADKAALMAKNKAALAARKAAKQSAEAKLKDAPLPAGWIRVRSSFYFFCLLGFTFATVTMLVALPCQSG
jgi:hypothetical protein